jgi:outer membrane immunogenic protein
MRTLLMSSVALAAMSAGALAADLPRRQAAPAPAPVYVAPVFTWSGFYVGLNAGATFGDRNRDLSIVTTDTVYRDLFLTGASGVRGDDSHSAFTGGAQAGFNWQFGALVAGIEADINYRGRGSHDPYGFDFSYNQTPYAFEYFGDRGGRWFGTLRPRIGFAMDRTLLYVTGGLAFGPSRDDGYARVTNATGGVVAEWRSSGDNGSNWGWTLGGGVEHAFSTNWTAKLEYLYVKLDDGSRTLTAVGRPDLPTIVARNDDKFHVVRVGLNYKFGATSAASPVLARY